MRNNTFVMQIKCPVCFSQNSALFIKIKFFTVKSLFYIYKCKDCSLLFNFPTYSNRDLKRLYGKSYYFFLRDEISELKRVSLQYKRVFSNLELSPNSKIIEIGSGRGYLLYILKQMGYSAKGVEISKEACLYAQRKFNVEVFNGTLEEYAKLTDERYDLILLIDLIEHIKDPHSFMNSLSLISKKGTKLVIDTPNSESRDIEIYKEKFIGFNPYHIRLYSLNSLTHLLRAYNFSILNYFYYGSGRIDIFKERFRNLLYLFKVNTLFDKFKILLRGAFKNREELIKEILFEIKNYDKKSLLENLKGDANILIYAYKE
ncbi:MAG: class I SAM-dependent methyltransferase [Candidatus Hydrothermales bacterium]